MELFSYLLKVSACSALFFAFYLLVLSKLTFFKINRFYLLASLLISFIIPAMQFSIERIVAAPIPIIASVAEPLALKSVGIEGANYHTPILLNAEPELEKHIGWYAMLPYTYGCIVGCLILLAIWRLYQLIKHTKAPVKEINGLKLFVKEIGFTNCSFFNYVFIDENSLTESELAVLLAHEAVHAKQFHSIDKVLMMIAKAVLWFNPIVYLYDKALEQVHEYEADEATSQHVGTAPYANLLLKLAVSRSSNPLLHNFVKSPIKQRIKMLFNSKSKNMKKLAYFMAIPMALGLVWLLATEVVYASVKRSTKVEEFVQDKPFVEHVKEKDNKGYLNEKITINSPGKPLSVSTGFRSQEKLFTQTLWFFINGKLYTEAEAQKFDAAFVKGLSTNKGLAFASNYDILGIEKKKSGNMGLVVWIGKEPKLSEIAAKNKSVYEKYNGTTVSGTVVKYSYSPSGKLMDGFILKTDDGVFLKAFVEAKFVKQANAMISKGEQVTIKIYNASYWKGTYPVLTSFKLMKGDKVLFDRWPKIASTKVRTIALETLGNNKVEYTAQDSTVVDKVNQMVHLYGKASLKHNQTEILADEIHYNLKTKMARAIDVSKLKQ
ncbi:M56 family metallopeptidase [Pedobacter sp. Du54]|uniref:M56 family metallopeptidase n=1 Tax=Pedobacter anseongensis TaxID=3133439 RepID=UPI0030AE60A9